MSEIKVPRVTFELKNARVLTIENWSRVSPKIVRELRESGALVALLEARMNRGIALKDQENFFRDVGTTSAQR